ncbi:hypothetical protein Pst134EA_019769 [Puccinia striiformis f. sp. tritici]|uniref:hypothetical protein n=1 Tax=Puccinia striiformis f. sp. tritici TaxID=168172 RepID=UPI0020078EAE|nr:hypothetical protein Pst134EA_019769 [Puccinia striiformis f. sp. tritici]KAH9459627.1 hypothetical protein Pst134EA_019769 [Puccinia striiformis f. sp. tritici]
MSSFQEANLFATSLSSPDEGFHRSMGYMHYGGNCWNPVLDITSAQRTPKRIRVTAETVTGKEDEVQQKNISLLNQISTIEKRTTSEYYNQQKQDSQLLNRIV